MSEGDLRQQLVEIIAEIGEIDDPGRITDDADLFTELDLDSMQAMEIVLEIERRLGLTVTEDDLREIRSLGSALAVAERLRAAVE